MAILAMLMPFFHRQLVTALGRTVAVIVGLTPVLALVVFLLVVGWPSFDER
jgi:hypothetical protein